MKPVLRPEQPADHLENELLTREAFWDLALPGRTRCDEHFLVHIMRTSPGFVPELAFVATLDGRLIGSILYTHSRIVSDTGAETRTLTFGPVSVLPAYQKQGVGGLLIRHTLNLAREAGHSAVVIFGHPEYYPRFGFRPAADFGITTPQGEAFPAFQALELYPGALQGVSGRFFHDPVYEIDPAELDAFEKTFPPR